MGLAHLADTTGPRRRYRRANRPSILARLPPAYLDLERTHRQSISVVQAADHIDTTGASDISAALTKESTNHATFIRSRHQSPQRHVVIYVVTHVESGVPKESRARISANASEVSTPAIHTPETTIIAICARRATFRRSITIGPLGCTQRRRFLRCCLHSHQVRATASYRSELAAAS
jgi:hypothetical protein